MTRIAAASQFRCAVYTRKSTEEGLEQEFNSLDAQHEACAAYIASQASLRWKLVPKRYDDGGISGGTMERPALQDLLNDIRQGQVDVVVVYKIDRLTRSLADFSKIVEVFDAQDVSFVSVTQQFNTTTSMGRLTLNVLLSFAQFEREVTAERIRDKIAASKRKGMWMGGAVPLGYENRDKKLVIVPAQAGTIKTIYRRYLELGSVRRLKEELDKAAHSLAIEGEEASTPPRTFSRGHLYWLLCNPVYVGDIRHKEHIVPGQHEAIIDRELWDAVQNTLKEQGSRRKATAHAVPGSLLTGLLFDETGDRLTPSQAIKDGKRYRYYISQRLMLARKKDSSGWRLPAHELDMVVMSALRDLLQDQSRLHRFLNLRQASIDLFHTVDAKASQLLQVLKDPSSEARKLLHKLIARIDLSAKELKISFNSNALHREFGASCEVESDKDKSSGSIPLTTITLPFAMRRRGVEARLIIGNTSEPASQVDAGLVDVISRARHWLKLLTSEGHQTIAALARRLSVDDGEVSRILPLAFLAPDIVEAILAGHQPVELTARRLIRFKPIPILWTDQRVAFGFQQA